MDGGAITGAVTYRGANTSAEIRVTRDREICTEPGATDRSVLTDAGGRLAGAVVSLRDIDTGRAPATAPDVAVHLRRCGFYPRVGSATVGRRLTLRNADALLHRPRADVGNTEVFRWAMPLPQSLSKKLREPGLMELRCLVHGWSRAWIWVFEHPYHTTTDEAGRFALEDVPPGSYTLMVWHERLGEVTREVRVGPRAVVTVNLAYVE